MTLAYWKDVVRECNKILWGLGGGVRHKATEPLLPLIALVFPEIISGTFVGKVAMDLFPG